MAAMRRWTKEIIVERLQQWKAEGVPTCEMHRRDRSMTGTAARLFGRWRLALDAANIEPIRTKWNRDRIIKELRQTRGKGLPVPDVLYAASRREFGTMRAACKTAGVPCKDNTLPHPSWDRDNAIEAIRDRNKKGHSLRATAREDPALYAAAQRLFGNWTKAREAAGFPMRRRPSLPAEEVLRQITAHASNKRSLTQLRESNPHLFNSAKCHFGSWLGACQAAGLPVKPRNSWTKEKVIAAIEKRHAAGRKLRSTWKEDTALFAAALHYFGNWQAALAAAGFEPAKRERWTKQRVIERLRAWHKHTDATNLKKLDQPIYAACYRLFGSDVAAMEAAGIEPRHQDAPGRKRWTKTRVLSEMQDRFIAGFPRDRLGFGDSKLAGAAKRHFGSWLAAVESAGLTDKVNFSPVPHRWTHKSVLAEIRAWHASGHRLTEIRRKNRSLYSAAKGRFGTWNQAIVAAGLQPERRYNTNKEILEDHQQRPSRKSRVEMSLTKEQLIRQLQTWHESGITVDKLGRQDQRVSSRAAALFGTWRTALGAAGLKSAREKWSRERILLELRQQYKNRQTKNPKLTIAARRYFGSMDKALKAAGLPVKTKPTTHLGWTRQDAVEAIRNRVADGNDLRVTCREDPGLYAAAKRLLGTWSAAREEAGFPIPSKKRFSADEVKRRIQTQHRKGLAVAKMRVHDLGLNRSAQRCFGSWRAAVEAAGLEWTTARRWSKPRVVQAMQERHACGALGRTWREDKPLFAAAARRFGSWEKAMRAAGFEPIRRERWTKQRVIERLRAWREHTRDTNLRITDQNLYSAAMRLFGSLDAAFQAANVTFSSRRWTDERVIAEIQERYVQGEPKHIQGLGDIRLACAAKRRFGSWAKAVEAAGLAGRIPVTKPLRRWSKQQVVDAIQRAVRDGVPMSDIRKTEQGLYNAAKTHFGTWRKAVMAAGIQKDSTNRRAAS